MTDNKICFSVVIPLYNKEATVKRAIKSVLNQTIQDFEIIIVNDGSTDKGPEIVKSIKDPRVTLINQKNQGVSAARNRGIIEAKHDLIAFLDADDEWLPEFLATIKRLAEQWPDCGLYATRYYLCAPSGNQYPAKVRGLSDNFEGILHNYFQVAVKGAPPVSSSAICSRKNALLDIEGFPVGVTSGEDLLTWARIAASYKIAYSVICLSIFYQTTSEKCETLPRRIPAYDDVVGRELARLLNVATEDKKTFLRVYCALWHKMRASCYLRLERRVKARHEILKSLHYSASITLLVYLLLSFSPGFIIKKAFLIGSSQ